MACVDPTRQSIATPPGFATGPAARRQTPAPENCARVSIRRISLVQEGFHGKHHRYNQALFHTLAHEAPLGPSPAFRVGPARHAFASAAVPARDRQALSRAEAGGRLGLSPART